MEIKTLQQAIQHFSDEQVCIDTVARLRWPDGPLCPACGHKEHYYLKTQKRWKCKECNRQFSVKLGTIFEDSPIGLDKWLLTLWMLANCKNGISSYEIHRAIGVTQKSAWFMLHRIRLAMQSGSLLKLGGGENPIEVDETFIGGKARNMHRDRHRRMLLSGSENKGKTIVVGLLERGGNVRARVVANRRREVLQTVIYKNIERGSTVYSDEHSGYSGISQDYAHKVINHLEKYVDGKVHTQGIENFWSLLKRQLNGTYIAVEPFHLFRYVDEQCFRYNNRGDRKNPVHDGQRFEKLLSRIAGKRLTFAEVTGKVGETSF
ncbi:MAG TPA: IS1595 family transposase [Candidatus Angelobacter sp.]|nr:IS1595 family transposase [Candidatus Angelobacter sp.]